MNKILVVTGSPRKNGDTAKLVRTIEEKIREYGDAEFFRIFLREKNLQFCRGCLVCMKRGEDSCPLKDDAPEIRDELLQADGVIFVTPVYVHTVTALMKNFIDRFAYFMHRPAFHNIPALVVSSTELSGLAETFDYMEFPVKAWGFTHVRDIGIIADAYKVEGKFRDETLDEIDSAAREFTERMHSAVQVTPSVKDIQFFNKLKTKIKLHRDNLPYDYQYWERMGWLESRYFYETGISPVKWLLGKLPVRIIMLVMRIKLGGKLYRQLVAAPLKAN